MMNKIKKTVIAEGVETEAQAELAKMAGCGHIQGYYYAIPMEESEFENFAVNHCLDIWCENINQWEQKENIAESISDK